MQLYLLICHSYCCANRNVYRWLVFCKYSNDIVMRIRQNNLQKLHCTKVHCKFVRFCHFNRCINKWISVCPICRCACGIVCLIAWKIVVAVLCTILLHSALDAAEQPHYLINFCFLKILFIMYSCIRYNFVAFHKH